MKLALQVLAILLLLPVPAAYAQINETGSAPEFVVKREQLETSDGESLSFQYVVVPDRQSLSDLVESLSDANNYPLVVLRNEVFEPGVQVIKNLDLQILNWKLRDQYWQELDSIRVEKFARMEEIALLQEQRVAVFDSANVQLREQIQQLNEQLDASVDLTKKTIRARQLRNVWIGALGGVFGFSLGVLLGAL